MVKTSKVKNGACFFQGVGNMLKNFWSHAYSSERDALCME